jgi:hypothetical protein
VSLLNFFSKGNFCAAALLVWLVAGNALHAEANGSTANEVKSPESYNGKPITVEGYLVIPEDLVQGEYRVKLFGSEDTYIVRLRADQLQWASECAKEPVKIEGIYSEGGIIVPTKLCHWYLDDTAWKLVCECNRYRAAHGLQPLTPARGLLYSAFNHSWNMRHRYGFRHGGTSGWSAENIAMGQPDPTSVTHTWYNSSGHRANMLNPNYRFIGVGYYGGMWTQQFR